MAFQENAPRQAHFPTPSAERGAVPVVDIPEHEAPEKHAEPVEDHEPHFPERFDVTLVFVALALLREHRKSHLLPCQAVELSRSTPLGAQRHLHRVHASEHDGGREDRVGILVEERVLDVVVVEGDEYGQSREHHTQDHAQNCRPRVGEQSVAHQTSGVDHRELVHQLHRVYKASHGQQLIDRMSELTEVVSEAV